MPGKKKAVWKGMFRWPFDDIEIREFRMILPVIIPSHEAGRIIAVEISREEARDIGMKLWEWGSQ